MQDEPFAPLPLVMHANAPVESLAEHVSPAGHVNGLEEQPAADESDVEDEHALAATAVATVAAVKKRSDPSMRMAGTVARA